MSRTKPIDYAGAAGRIALERISELGPRWVVQPKLDGSLCRVSLDGRGRISRLYSRGGEFPRKLVAGLVNQHVGRPWSELVGELEAWTESANRLASCRGWRQLHLFDCIRDGTRYVAREPYHVRRDALWRMQSEVANDGADLPWFEDVNGDAHSRSTGQFVAATPTDWRLTPIVPQMAACRSDEAWSEWVAKVDGEGLVAVNLDAPMGGRRSKLKCKAGSTLDCVVVATSPRRARVMWQGVTFGISTMGRAAAGIAVGDVVEVAHMGWYEKTSTPRHAVLVRRRQDLAVPCSYANPDLLRL